MSTSLTAANQLTILAIKTEAMHTESASPPDKKQLCPQWPRMARAERPACSTVFQLTALQSHLLLLLTLVHISL